MIRVAGLGKTNELTYVNSTRWHARNARARVCVVCVCVCVHTRARACAHERERERERERETDRNKKLMLVLVGKLSEFVPAALFFISINLKIDHSKA